MENVDVPEIYPLLPAEGILHVSVAQISFNPTLLNPAAKLLTAIPFHTSIYPRLMIFTLQAAEWGGAQRASGKVERPLLPSH